MFFRFSHAAIAYEQCDRKFKAVFAEPRVKGIKNEINEKNMNHSYDYAPSKVGMLPLPDVHNSEGYTGLAVIAHPSLNQDMLWKLFDIVPGNYIPFIFLKFYLSLVLLFKIVIKNYFYFSFKNLNIESGMDYCQVRYEVPTNAFATVVYCNPQWAAYACEKFHGFEYPPGQRLIVKPDLSYRAGRSFSGERIFGDSSRNFDDNTGRNFNEPGRRAPANQSDILRLAETIAQATSLIQASGFNPSEVLSTRLQDNSKNTLMCSVRLPDPKPLAQLNEPTVAR